MRNRLGTCRCGNADVAWGSDRAQNINFVHCAKCNRYVEAETMNQTVALWNEPLKITEVETTAGRVGRVGYGIY